MPRWENELHVSTGAVIALELPVPLDDRLTLKREPAQGFGHKRYARDTENPAVAGILNKC